MTKITPEEARQILESWHSVAESVGHESDYEPSILDCNMFCVYIGDLVKEISTGKIWTVDDIGKDFIVGKIGEQTNYMSQSKFLWVATPKMPIGKGWK